MKKDILVIFTLILLAVLLISGSTFQSVDEFYAPTADTSAPSSAAADSPGTAGPVSESAAAGTTVMPTAPDIPAPAPAVTISIRCDTVLSRYDDLDPALRSDEFVPPDGVILPPTRYTLNPGDSVFDVLNRAVRENRIQMEYQGADANIFGSVYIQGIHYLYEFSCGPLSGWMYRVDGEFPNYGCSEYIPRDGQVIEWVYTCDLGQDVGCEWIGESSP